MLTNFLDLEDLEDDFDIYINSDSPDTEHFIYLDPDTSESERCVKLTTLDYTGDPVHCVYNLESLEYLISSLVYCKTSLLQTIHLDGELDD